MNSDIHIDVHYVYILHVSLAKKGKRNVQGVPQSQTVALPRPQEEEETDKSKQAQTEQKYATLNTEIHKNSVRIKAPNSVNASKRKHKNQINHYN